MNGAIRPLVAFVERAQADAAGRPPWNVDEILPNVRADCVRRIHSLIIHVEHQCENLLPLIATAYGGLGRVLGVHQRGKEQTGQDGDYGDNDQEFDEGERAGLAQTRLGQTSGGLLLHLV